MPPILAQDIIQPFALPGGLPWWVYILVFLVLSPNFVQVLSFIQGTRRERALADIRQQNADAESERLEDREQSEQITKLIGSQQETLETILNLYTKQLEQLNTSIMALSSSSQEMADMIRQHIERGDKLGLIISEWNNHAQQREDARNSATLLMQQSTEKTSQAVLALTIEVQGLRQNVDQQTTDVITTSQSTQSEITKIRQMFEGVVIQLGDCGRRIETMVNEHQTVQITVGAEYASIQQTLNKIVQSIEALGDKIVENGDDGKPVTVKP